MSPEQQQILLIAEHRRLCFIGEFERADKMFDEFMKFLKALAGKEQA